NAVVAGALAREYGTRRPAAVFVTEIVGNVGHIEALVRKQVWQRKDAPKQVGASAGIDCNHRFGLDVVVGLAQDSNLDAGGFGERIHDRRERVVFRWHKSFPPPAYSLIGVAHALAGRYDEASLWAEKGLLQQPNSAAAARVAAASHALAGRLDQAHRAAARLRQIDPTFRVSDLRRMFAYRRPEDL